MADAGTTPSCWGSEARPRMPLKEYGKIVASYFSGVVKGVFLLPIVLPVLVLGVLVSNIVALPLWIDHGFMTIKYNRLIGRNLKILAALAFPLVILAYLALTTAASLPFALVFALLYPGFVTIEIKRQSAWRWAYLWAGWRDTLIMLTRYVTRYYYSVTMGFKEQARLFRRRAWPVTHDIHPLNWTLAALMTTVGSTALYAALAALLTLKMPLLMLRAFLNHLAARDMWFRGPALSTAWVAGLVLVPCGPPLLLVAALPLALYRGWEAAQMTIATWGDVRPGGAHLAACFVDVHVWSGRYIMRQDVPFMALPQGTRFHLGWLLAGILPVVVGLVVVPPLSLALVLLSIMPVITAAWSKIGTGMASGSVQAKPSAFIGLGVLGMFAPVVAPVALMGLFAWSVVDVFTAALVTHSKRSLMLGLQYPFGLLYRVEYAINKFSLALDDREQVHWASLLPRVFGMWAQPYMDPAEWDMGGGMALPISMVGRPPRLVPAGMRRPRFDEQGRLVDMTSAAYDVPGVGLTRVDPNGQVRPPGKGGVPFDPAKGSSGVAGAGASSVDGSSEGSEGPGYDLSRARFPISGKPSYGPDILPPAYRSAFSSMIIGGVVAGGMGSVQAAAASTTGASKASRPATTAAGASAEEVAVSVEGEGEALPSGQPRDALAIQVEEEATGLAGTPRSGGYEANVVTAAEAQQVVEVDGAGGCCAWLTAPEPVDGWEDDGDEVALPRTPGGETLLTPEIVQRAKEHQTHRRRASVDRTSGAGAGAAGSSAAAAAGTGAAGVGGLTLREPATATPAKEAQPAAGAGAGSGAGAAAETAPASPAAGTASASTSAAGGAAGVAASSPAPAAAAAAGEGAAEGAAAAGTGSLSPVSPIAPTAAASGTEGGEQVLSPASTAAAAVTDAASAASGALQEAAEALAGSSASAAGGLGSPTAAGAGAEAAAAGSASKAAAGSVSPTSAFAAAIRSAAASRLADSTEAAGPAGGQQQDAGQGDEEDEEEYSDEEEEEDEDDEEEDVFVLQPVVKPELPDEWVAVKDSTGATYYANYARNQSSWRVPPGVKVASVAVAARAAMTFMAKARQAQAQHQGAK